MFAICTYKPPAATATIALQTVCLHYITLLLLLLLLQLFVFFCLSSPLFIDHSTLSFPQRSPKKTCWCEMSPDAFLSPNQQCQSTEGIQYDILILKIKK